MKTSLMVIHWLPRILCILAILFIGMFSLDVFAPGHTIWQQLGGFLVHNIPSFVLLAILIYAWKREYTGGIIFIIFGLLLCVSVFLINYHRNHFSMGRSLGIVAVVAFPLVIVGILFIWSYNMKRKASHTSK
jgi:hypothetical protein